ncbi:MAG: nitroreductase family protein [Bacteroidota bacterium]
MSCAVWRLTGGRWSRANGWRRASFSTRSSTSTGSQEVNPSTKFLSLVRQRRSVRRYTGRPVERDKLERCLEAARLAPSADSGQPWRFVVVDEPGLRARIAGAVSGGMDLGLTRMGCRCMIEKVFFPNEVCA